MSDNLPVPNPPQADAPLAAAMAYTRRGWRVIPVPHRSKNPGFDGWQRLRLAEEDLPQHFNGRPQNLGVLTGEPSGWLVDVDLDHLICVERADEFLPPTPAVFGRTSKPRSHRVYRVTAPVATKKHRSRSAGMLVELRSTGGQTVFPPSTHESGEPIAWEDPAAELALVEPEMLLAAVKALADAARVELGEKAPPKRPTAATPSRAPAAAPTPAAPASEGADGDRDAAAGSPDHRARAAVDAMLRMSMADHHDGSARLFAAACRAVEHDLSDAQALAAIRQYERQRPFPVAWSDGQVLARLRDAEKKAERGAALAGPVPLGGRDPATGRLVLSPRRTLPTAEAFVREFHAHPQGRTIHAYAGSLLAWRGNRYAEVEAGSLRQRLQPWLHDALRYVLDKRTGQTVLADFEANPGTVEAALESLRSYAHLGAHLTPPCWLDGRGERGERGERGGPEAPDPRGLLPFPSGTLDLATGEVLAPTPALFNVSALDFDYDPSAPPPRRWLAFVGEELWPDDPQSVGLLQEWTGYCLVADTSQQKMLLMVGPRRSGKGTVGRVLARLVGPANVVGPTTSSLAGPFGLQPLIGKSLAVVSDARFAGENVGVVVERLLCVSGEDALSVDRKFMGSVTMKLPTRFVFLTNELPRMNDASAALAGRFVTLRLTRSFYGREDTSLTTTLMAELPGILLWAVEGLRRLRARGRFVQPRSSEDAVREMEDLASPVLAFVRDACEVAPGRRAWVDELYRAWQRWCELDGRTAVTNKQTFGRDLAAAVPGLTRRRGAGDATFYDGIGLRPEVGAEEVR